MGDEPGGFVTRAEHCELDALRCRAYGLHPDIFDDAAAVSRLQELEDRVCVEHSHDVPSRPTGAHAADEHAPAARRRLTLAITSAAAVAVILGGYAWGTAALRDEVRSGSAVVDDTHQVIGEQFRPLGIMYGREVGVGPTLDGQYCMVVEDAPEPSVTCVPGSDIPATPASVILPTRHHDPDTHAVVGLGRLVRYSLLPSGGVSAEPVVRGPPKS